MVLAHLPAIEEHHHGNSYSILLGFRVVQDLSKFIMVLNHIKCQVDICIIIYLNFFFKF